MIRLRWLICNHRWEYLSKPSYCTDIICNKCKRVKFIIGGKKPKLTKMKRRNYIWCPKCGNDVMRDSFISQDKQGIAKYKCSRCKHESSFIFGIAPVPLPLPLEND